MSKSQPAELVIRLRRHRAILECLARLAAEEAPLDGFLQRVADDIARAVEIDRVKVMRYRSQTSDFLSEAGVGWAPGVVGTATFAADFSSPPGLAFRTANPVVVDELQSSPFAGNPVLAASGLVSLASVPILVDRAAWGVLEIASMEPRQFDQETIGFLLTAASITGAFIGKVQAREQEADAHAAWAGQARAMELAIREQQHRVKNYFQLILSMIALQRSRFPTEEGRRLVDAIVQRILAIAIAHDQLSPTRRGEVVSLPAYLTALSAALEKPAEMIAISLNVAEVCMGVESAVPIGLIVNELVTNSLKYAFGPEGGRIRIELEPMSSTGGMLLLTVADNGRGVSPDATPGTGSRLLEGLVAQIGGEMHRLDAKPGTAIQVCFPRPPISA